MEADFYRTVNLTPVTDRGAEFPVYTTNDDAITITKTADGWSVGADGGMTLVRDLPSLEAVIDFVLGCRRMLAPANQDD